MAEEGCKPMNTILICMAVVLFIVYAAVIVAPFVIIGWLTIWAWRMIKDIGRTGRDSGSMLFKK
tara:strand:+ start:191 stop:382 length:192 start_codon:yes stop_codon:yes gene_type:complete